jgi:hypothetical protein
MTVPNSPNDLFKLIREKRDKQCQCLTCRVSNIIAENETETHEIMQMVRDVTALLLQGSMQKLSDSVNQKMPIWMSIHWATVAATLRAAASSAEAAYIQQKDLTEILQNEIDSNSK